MPQILITLTEDDMTLMKAIDAYIQKSGGRTPKKREIVTTDCLARDYKATRAARVFERLKLLGIVDHHLNGHCQLTEQGKQALSAA